MERCRLLAGLVGRPSEPQATISGLGLRRGPALHSTGDAGARLVAGGSYTWRNTAAGSVRPARRAGSPAATTVSRIRSAPAAAIATGSVAETA